MLFLIVCASLAALGTCLAIGHGVQDASHSGKLVDREVVLQEPADRTAETVDLSSYDHNEVRDEKDRRAVTEETAFSWDGSERGDNPRAFPAVTEDTGSDGWNLGSRAHTNTTTLITLQDFVEKAHYLEDVAISGMLYEDNNSDGQPNSGDNPIPRAQMHALWDDGSVHRQYFTFFTQEDDGEEGEAGKWEFNFTVTETALGPKELEVIYNGEWTQNGSWFYEVNDTAYTGADMDLDGEIDAWGIHAQSKLLTQRYQYDDDGNNGVDEEFFDFANTPSITYPWPSDTYESGGPLDNDGDGEYDEDVAAFIARFPTNKIYMIQLWHEASLSSKLGQPSVVAGDPFTVSGQVRDASVPTMSMGKKTLEIFFNNQLVGQTVAVEGYNAGDPTDKFSEYSFTYTVPKNAPPGTHEVTIRMRPEYNVSTNMYYEPVNITKYIKVLRPTEIIFDNVGEEAWVYHTKQIFVNGSIVDRYYYRNYGIKEGIRLDVGGQSFAKMYMFNLYWTKGSTYIKKGPFYVNNTNASFSVPLVIPGDQELGPVNVTIELLCDNTYYLPSVNSTEYVTRATTSMDLWLDQNNNGKRNEAGTYVTRVEYIDAGGRMHYWNTAHIKGQLVDNELTTGKFVKGVADQEVVIWWAYGESWQKQYTAVTDSQGMFAVDVEIEFGHVLGPVVVAASFQESPHSCYYDPSNFYDPDGDPFSVVSLTRLSLVCDRAVKGESLDVSGVLRDDRGIGLNNRTVCIYWMTEKEKNDYLKDPSNLGLPIATVSTGTTGVFRSRDWEVPKEQPVGPAYLLAVYDGSDAWPDGPDGTMYLPTDAYSRSFSPVVPCNVSANTVLELDKTNSDKAVRFQKFTVKGRLWEAFKGEIRRSPVKGVPVEAYLIDSKNREFFLGRAYTFNENLETDGSFQITETIPRGAAVGEAVIRLQFNGTDYYIGSANLTGIEVWTDCAIRAQEIPDDKDGDGKLDIYLGEMSESDPVIFHIKIVEDNSLEDTTVEIEYGIIWLEISGVDIVRLNLTRGVTDEHGRYVFSFSKPFRDTAFGKLFVSSQDVEVRINISYEGGRYYNGETRTYDAVMHPPPPPPPNDPWPTIIKWAIFILIIFSLFGIVMFFTARWLRKRARIRGMKRIIRRAADQLVAGNEYTAVIFKSYQKLGAHLRKYGYLRRDSETFREFEDAIKAALPIDRVSMNEFLKLLEEARYSHHKIGEEQRNDAIKNLRNIEASLERIILDESSAMKALEALEEADYRDTEILVLEGTGLKKP